MKSFVRIFSSSSESELEANINSFLASDPELRLSSVGLACKVRGEEVTYKAIVAVRDPYK